MTKYYVFVILWLTLIACYDDQEGPGFPIEQVEGYKPVYASANALAADIKLEAPRKLQNPGKIYTIGRYLFINEQGIGVHIYDNQDPSRPVAMGFLTITGNTDVATKGNILYVNNLTDLVALDITDVNNIKELSRQTQPYWAVQLPPVSDTYFECVDPTKGTVVSWERAALLDPKCYQ